ncbi:putative flavonol synthase [Medicago truncatula]|uniref:Flavonol synthase/flavanone 3-hydroxylase n=1 Tax=Medicago truncatula TaxID=3880 RepID=G7K8X0_MEDTR|nr:flavonol synthase/flavanone 3-hydroxylase [Medicago truncatula]AES97739.1 flavonol synthase/flavanone 3-hydroxylase [Medicago truncatula]RHN55967.1 putative flavonol synthase [Medicago truncatula]
MEVERVQTIAHKSKNTTIPSMFVRSETESPGTTTVQGVKLGVPIIDFSNPDEVKVQNEIIEASKEWGMFQIVNHEIPNEVIRKLQSVGKEFFELPQDEKEVYAKPVIGSDVSSEGYGTKHQKELSGKRGWVDHFFHIIWPPSSVNYSCWPNNPTSYREVNEEYGKYLRRVSNKLFNIMLVGLGFEENELKSVADENELIHLLKINYYPPCPCPDLVLGVPPHTDMCYITLLIPNEVEGLQASRDGQWYDVKYVPNALIIHVGDQMQILSNGKYKAVLHRTTVNKDETRMSWPVFIEPKPENEVGPHPKFVNQENPPKYKTKKYKDYAYCKLNKIPQ